MVGNGDEIVLGLDSEDVAAGFRAGATDYAQNYAGVM